MFHHCTDEQRLRKEKSALRLLNMVYMDLEKKRARDAAYRAANPEKVKAATVAWRMANPEKMKATTAAWRMANTEKERARKTAWRVANPEKVKAASSAWYNTEEGWRKALYLSSKNKAEQGGYEPINMSTVPSHVKDITHCKICNKSRGNRRLMCDHCHKTGKFRAMLCSACNTALGYYEGPHHDKYNSYLKEHATDVTPGSAQSNGLPPVSSYCDRVLHLLQGQKLSLAS